MTPIDRIRYRLIAARARHRHDSGSLGLELRALLGDAMTEERRNSGAATEHDLETRYGFTPEEIREHARAAIDDATTRYVDGGVPDPGSGGPGPGPGCDFTGASPVPA